MAAGTFKATRSVETSLDTFRARGRSRQMSPGERTDHDQEPPGTRASSGRNLHGQEQPDSGGQPRSPQPEVLQPPARSSTLQPIPCLRWPQHAGVAQNLMERRQGATQLSPALRGNLWALGIYRERGREPKKEGTDRAAGETMSKRSGSSPNAFRARARSGQGS